MLTRFVVFCLAEELSKRTGSDYCRRDQMYVNFEKIYGENNFIIAPEGYSAYYCHGQCSHPMGKDMKPTNHAIFQGLMQVLESVPGPCCVPTKLSIMSVLYIDDDNAVQLKKMKNMVAEECGCQ